MPVSEFKVVETSNVTDESLTTILNDMTQAGWVYDGMTFVPNDASKRPKLAFILFTRSAPGQDVGH